MECHSPIFLNILRKTIFVSDSFNFFFFSFHRHIFVQEISTVLERRPYTTEIEHLGIVMANKKKSRVITRIINKLKQNIRMLCKIVHRKKTKKTKTNNRMIFLK